MNKKLLRYPFYNPSMLSRSSSAPAASTRVVGLGSVIAFTSFPNGVVHQGERVSMSPFSLDRLGYFS